MINFLKKIIIFKIKKYGNQKRNNRRDKNNL
jgi:hypothetical protein